MTSSEMPTFARALLTMRALWMKSSFNGLFWFDSSPFLSWEGSLAIDRLIFAVMVSPQKPPPRLPPPPSQKGALESPIGRVWPRRAGPECDDSLDSPIGEPRPRLGSGVPPVGRTP